ncbi:hypothetical protein K502DRAFT_361290 [Neoconidiobolus thromboides FSU 785]|nr:hypothetical protein K502DRAFT_361290 [Neoconidiobolus thromboides FSU 785]
MQFTSILNLIYLINLSYALKTIRFCGDGKEEICFEVKPDGKDTLVTMRGPADSGYLAFGIGSSMKDSDIYVGFFNSTNSPVVSYRGGAFYREPKALEDQSNIQVMNLESSIADDKSFKLISFKILNTANESVRKVDFDIKNKFIWAHSSIPPKGDDINAKIHKHKKHGKYQG